LTPSSYRLSSCTGFFELLKTFPFDINGRPTRRRNRLKKIIEKCVSAVTHIGAGRISTGIDAAAKAHCCCAITCLGLPRDLTMNAPLRVNEALLIAGHAFEPFQCVAWAPQDGNGELSLTVIDRTSTRIGRKQVPSSTYTDPSQLADLIEQVRAELSQEGYALQPWSMPR
jgi:hypothetical protein